jgi:hypothetical protein
MQNLTFSGCREPASEQDLADIARSVGSRLPESFRSHYARWNGGMPSLDWFPARLRLRLRLSYVNIKGRLIGIDLTHNSTTNRTTSVSHQASVGVAMSLGA